MKAVIVDRWMNPADLTVGEADEPVLTEGKILVDVKAAGVNFFDTLIVQGKYQVRPEFPFFPGGEIAGVVLEVGSEVTAFAPGDRIAAHVGHGGFAERVAVEEAAAMPIAESMTFEQAAAFPIVYGTAYAAVVVRGQTRPGETVLVTAAAGGVGLASVQVARAVGARVIALASGDKLSAALEAGAHVAVDYRQEGWVDRIKEETAGRGADVIVENVGGDVFDGCTRSIAWGGRLVVSGFSSGRIPELRVNRVMLKHISIVGLHFGPMAEHEPDTVREMYRRLFELAEASVLKPCVSEVFPMARVGAALDAIGNRRTIGKIVLVP